MSEPRRTTVLAPPVQRTTVLPAPLMRTTVVSGQGPAGVPGDGVATFQSLWYSYGDATPALIGVVLAGRVVAIEISVDTPFDGIGAALTIGTLANSAELMGLDDIDPTVVATFEKAPQVEYPVATPIYLFITPGSGASLGAGALLVQSF